MRTKSPSMPGPGSKKARLRKIQQLCDLLTSLSLVVKTWPSSSSDMSFGVREDSDLDGLAVVYLSSLSFGK